MHDTQMRQSARNQTVRETKAVADGQTPLSVWKALAREEIEAAQT
jgi:hypothetical protein